MSAERVDRPHGGWWAAILGGLGLNAAVGFVPSAYDVWAAHVSAALSQETVRAIFLVAVVIHIAEASYAHRVAMQAGLGAAAQGWFWQTLALGFPSLRLLRARAATGVRR